MLILILAVSFHLYSVLCEEGHERVNRSHSLASHLGETVLEFA